jgi:trehalose 6-phosphate phosphatase
MKAAELFVPKAESVCLFLDVDGTLIDLAPTPDAVVVSETLLEELTRLERSLDGALAFVSGRTIEELDGLFAPLRLRASGVHGAEIRYAPLEPILSLTNERFPDGAWSRLQVLIEQFPGVFAENKGASYAVHYKLVPWLEADLFLALKRYAENFLALGVQVIRGLMVFELKLPGFDKGAAIRRFMARAPFAGRRPVFIADDKMDWPGFETVLALGGVGFSVGREIAGLTGSFPQPAAVRAWLGKVAA